jgi:hypothetical protein
MCVSLSSPFFLLRSSLSPLSLPFLLSSLTFYTCYRSPALSSSSATQQETEKEEAAECTDEKSPLIRLSRRSCNTATHLTILCSLPLSGEERNDGTERNFASYSILQERNRLLDFAGEVVVPDPAKPVTAGERQRRTIEKVGSGRRGEC